MAADLSRAFPRGEDEFEALIQGNKYQVYATARAYLSNASEADTIVQETFIDAYFNYCSLKDESKGRHGSVG